MNHPLRPARYLAQGLTHSLASLALLCGASAHAQGWSAALTLSSDRVERGVSQSSGQAALSADGEWQHRSGAYLGLGLSTVDPDQFGGAALQWSPRLGWRGSYAQDAGRWGLGLTAHRFPGASGQRASALPARAGAAATTAQDTNFATAELNLSAGWKGLSLNLDRSLGDYYGIGENSVYTGALGQRVSARLADSAGSWHVGLRYQHNFTDSLSAWAGVGRQVVNNFDGLSYTDWSLGASVQALGLSWALEGTATNASSDYWQLTRNNGDSRELASRRATVSVSWVY